MASMGAWVVKTPLSSFEIWDAQLDPEGGAAGP